MQLYRIPVAFKRTSGHVQFAYQMGFISLSNRSKARLLTETYAYLLPSPSRPHGHGSRNTMYMYSDAAQRSKIYFFLEKYEAIIRLISTKAERDKALIAVSGARIYMHLFRVANTHTYYRRSL